jgi:hypothetical protein
MTYEITVKETESGESIKLTQNGEKDINEMVYTLYLILYWMGYHPDSINSILCGE